MNEIKIYKSPWKALKLMLLCSPFVIISLYDIIEHKLIFPTWLNWCCLCFFGLGIPIGIFNLFDRRPQIIINSYHIFARPACGVFKNANKGIVEWEFIKDVYLRTYSNDYHGITTSKRKMICFALKKNESGNKTKLSRALKLGDFNIPLTNLEKINELNLIDFIKSMAQADVGERKEQLKRFTPSFMNYHL